MFSSEHSVRLKSVQIPIDCLLPNERPAMQTMTDHMAMMPDPMDMHKKTGATTKKDKGMADDQKK